MPAVASAKQPRRTAKRCEFGPGVNVILDHDLQPKRGVIKKRDQKQDHQNAASGVLSQAMKLA